MTTPRVLAVCVRAEWLPEPDGTSTAIDKRAVPGRVAVVHDRGEGTGPGLVGDAVGHPKVHGGPRMAVYAFSQEEADWWAAQLGVPIPPGLFGENLRTTGLDLESLTLGQEVTLGESGLVLAVAGIRTPCATFARRMGQPQWVRRFADRGRCGTYLSVVRPGDAGAGDALTVGPIVAGAPTIAEAFRERFPRS